MMNYKIDRVSLMGKTIEGEEIYHVALLNNSAYEHIGLKTYYMLYVPRENNESLMRDYIGMPLYEPSYEESFVEKLLNNESQWIECLIVKIDHITGNGNKYGYTEWPYKLYSLIDSRTIDYTKDNYTTLNKKHYEYPENDYLENRVQYDKILERCIVEMKLSSDDFWSSEDYE